MRFKESIVLTAMDTMAGLWLFSPPAELDSSARVVEKLYKMFHPFIQFPFPRNMHLPEPFAVFTDTLVNDVTGTPYSYSRFDMVIRSRPLFLGCLSSNIGPNAETRRLKQDYTISLDFEWCEAADLACSKLLGVMTLDKLEFSRGISSKSLSTEFYIMFSIFSARFPILPLNTIARQQLVNGNIATLRSVSEDRDVARVTYVEEPLVGEAAVRVMNTMVLNGSVHERMFDIGLAVVCNEALESQLGYNVEYGSFAELAASMLVARAFDCANNFANVFTRTLLLRESGKARVIVKPDANGEYPTFAAEKSSEYRLDSSVTSVFSELPHAGAPVTVFKWICTLINGQAAEDLRDRLSGANSQQFPALAGWVRILQFIPSKNRHVYRIDLRRLYMKYASMACHRFCPGFDLVVPFLIHPPRAKDGSQVDMGATMTNGQYITASPANFSGIFIQVKAYSDAVSRPLHSKIVKHLIQCARDIVPEGPIVTMVFYLRAGVKHCMSRRAEIQEPHTRSPDHYATVCLTPDEILRDMCQSDFCHKHHNHVGEEGARETAAARQTSRASSRSSRSRSPSAKRPRRATPRMTTEIDACMLEDVVHVTCSGMSLETFGPFISKTLLQKMQSVISKDVDVPVEILESEKLFARTGNEMRDHLRTVAPLESEYMNDPYEDDRISGGS